MKVSITTLSENVAGMPDVLAEWGLSVLVETDESTILFDTGRSQSTINNIDRLGVDVSRIDRIILSHGHYDHTGGLHSVLSKMKKKVEVIAHPDVWADKFGRHKGQEDRFIGIPYQRVMLESLGAVFQLERGPVAVTDNILTTGEVPMVTAFEKVDSHLAVRKNGQIVPDEVLDDRALIFKTDMGLVVILGCAHRGMVNTLLHARQITGVNTIYAVLGGAHLHNASEEQVWQTVDFLKTAGIQKLGLCHCTGLPVMALISQEFGDGFIFNSTGTRVNFPEE
jgi:7,8-dihydropterin-6-yl-methyl-4-(beta-D-ribofuranosyl)aminobenzene 5'-phosphate synthase